MDSNYNPNDKIFVRSSDKMFLNSRALFIEYHDVIRSPYFTFLTLINKNRDIFKNFLDLSQIEGLNDNSLIEWYYARENQNILLELLNKELYDQIDFKELDSLINNQLLESDKFITGSPLLSFGHVLQNMLSDGTKLVDHIYIYNKYPNKYIEEDVNETFQEKVSFVTGELKDILSNVDKDATYVFSDMSNIEILESMDRINFSSILIPYEYNYNKTQDDDYILDLEYYHKKYIFKLNFFYATYL